MCAAPSSAGGGAIATDAGEGEVIPHYCIRQLGSVPQHGPSRQTRPMANAE